MRRPFDAKQCRILEKLAEAMFYDVEMVISPAQVVENLQTHLAMIEGPKPQQIGHMVTAVGLLLGGPLFVRDSVAGRAKTIRKRLQEARLDLFQDLARIRSIIYAGYYGHWEGLTEADNRDNPVHRQIGFTLPAFRDRSAPGELPITRHEGRDLTRDDFVGHDNCPAEVDIVVIGSGAGGAVAAYNLARLGHDVLIVEAGAHYASKDITHEERRMTARLFKDGAAQTSRNNEMVIFQAQCVGGGTVLNNGIALRVDQPGMIHPQAPDIFDKWASIGAKIDRPAFNRAYDAVEQYLGIETINPMIGRNNGPHLLRGWAAYAKSTGDPADLAAPATWFRKNWGPNSAGAPCVYCGYCNTGCPYGRKNGMAQSYLPDARRHGVRIMAEARVTQIHWRRHNKRVAESVNVTLAGGRRQTIRVNKGVVVAAGTLASSRILTASGIMGAGEGVSLNIASPVAALMPHDMRVWDEDQMATFVDRGDYLIESHFQPPMSMATMLSGWFGEHARKMANYSRLASAGILFHADRRSRVVRNGFDFNLDVDEHLPLIRRALGALTRVHFAGGALEVYPPLPRGGIITPDIDIDAFLKTHIREPGDIVMTSSHPQGGNAMNADPSLGIVDEDCRIHGTTNVMVTDASVFPSCVRVNSQLTVMAMSHYATHRGGVFGTAPA